MSDTSSVVTLLPCPFCRGPASVHKGMQAFNDYEIHCDTCGMCGPNFGAMDETPTPEQDAIAAWNTRAALAVPEVAALVEAAEKAIGRLTGYGETSTVRIELRAALAKLRGQA